MTAASRAMSSPATGTETDGSGRISKTSPMMAAVAIPSLAVPATRRREAASQAAGPDR
jgi:hypothetical protein